MERSQQEVVEASGRGGEGGECLRVVPFGQAACREADEAGLVADAFAGAQMVAAGMAVRDRDGM